MFTQKSVRWIVLGLLGVAMLLAACAAGTQTRQTSTPTQDASTQPNASATPESAVVERRTSQVGEEFSVTLEGNITTGYAWEVTRMDEGMVQLVSNDYITDSNSDQTLVGQGGRAILHFRAMVAGQTIIELAYRRAWEKGIAPLRTYVVELTVQ